METQKFPRRKQIHLNAFDYASPDHIFFVTICSANKRNHFSDPEISQVLIRQLEFRRSAGEIKLYCYCLMPDHLHLLLSLTEVYILKGGAFGERTLQSWVSAFKRFTSRTIEETFKIKPLWQRNFYDHVVRTDESVREICTYILGNPVRKDIVSSWEDYPFSRIADPLPG